MPFLWYAFHALINYGLPDDVNMVFEACRRRKKSKRSINLKRGHFVGLHYIIVSQCRVQKKHIVVEAYLLSVITEHMSEISNHQLVYRT